MYANYLYLIGILEYMQICTNYLCKELLLKALIALKPTNQPTIQSLNKQTDHPPKCHKQKSC